MKIFFAAPFTGKIDVRTSQVETQYRDWLHKIHLELLNNGYKVVSAHEREDWGNALDSPKDAIFNDYNSILESDILVAYVGDPPSYGVQMELGFAVALKKPILILRNANVQLPYLMPGLGRMTQTAEIIIEEHKDLIGILTQILRDFQKSKTT
jgi:nucleoside 2-deoxyribosyltransferase